MFVLASKSLYNVSRDRIRELILPLINLAGIKLANKRIYSRVFDLYVASAIDYSDAYIAALMENRKELELYSYDTHFDRIATIKRIEP